MESPHGQKIFGSSGLLQIIARIGNVRFDVFNFHPVFFFVKSSKIDVGNENVMSEKIRKYLFFKSLIHQQRNKVGINFQIYDL